MGLFNSKKKKENETEDVKTEVRKPEIKQYIEGAGESIVSKSILEGTSRLKWLFRQNNGQGNGWIAFGDRDTQEYVDNPDNMAVVDFNVLANLEPAVVNVFHMPYGADLEFRTDASGSYFVDTATGEEIREQVRTSLQAVFEENLKFLNKETYPETFFQSLFQNSGRTETYTVGEADFPTGKIVLADPIVYLGSRYMVTLEQKIPAGSYPIDLSICHSDKVGLRIAAARLRVSGSRPVRHEIAMPEGNSREDLGKPGVWAFFGVDAGLACISDKQVAANYRTFISRWKQEHPDKNEYYDYFASLFRKSYEMCPGLQRESGDFLLWQIPDTEEKVVMFASGMGDGIYSGYWGLDEQGQPAELVIPFLNPEYMQG